MKTLVKIIKNLANEFYKKSQVLIEQSDDIRPMLDRLGSKKKIETIINQYKKENKIISLQSYTVNIDATIFPNQNGPKTIIEETDMNPDSGTYGQKIKKQYPIEYGINGSGVSINISNLENASPKVNTNIEIINKSLVPFFVGEFNKTIDKVNPLPIKEPAKYSVNYTTVTI